MRLCLVCVVYNSYNAGPRQLPLAALLLVLLVLVVVFVVVLAALALVLLSVALVKRSFIPNNWVVSKETGMISLASTSTCTSTCASICTPPCTSAYTSACTSTCASDCTQYISSILLDTVAVLYSIQ